MFSLYQRRYNFLGPFFFTNLSIKCLVIFHIPCQVQFYQHLGFPVLSTACSDDISVFFPDHVSPLPLPVHFLCIPQLTSRFLVSHTGFLPPLFDFLYMGMETTWALRKLSLKFYHLYFVLLSLKTAFHVISSNNFSNSWKFPLLNFRVLSLFFVRPLFLEITNTTRVWPLHPRLSPVLTYLMSSSALVTTDWPSNA